jgi:hypothetical protein
MGSIKGKTLKVRYLSVMIDFGFHNDLSLMVIDLLID